MARHWDTTLPLCGCIDILLLNGRQSQAVNPCMSGMYMIDSVYGVHLWKFTLLHSEAASGYVKIASQHFK